MDGRRFDGLTKGLATASSRRTITRALTGLGAAVLGITSLEATDAARKKGKRHKSHISPEAKPGRTVEPLDFSVDLTAGTACDFPVRVQWKGQEVTLTFDGGDTSLDPGDRLIITVLGLSATLTNLATETSLQVSITGPEFVQFNEDGTVTVRGPGPWLFVRRHPETLEPGLWLVRGLSLRTFLNRVLQTIEIHGRSENLCAALA